MNFQLRSDNSLLLLRSGLLEVQAMGDQTPTPEQQGEQGSVERRGSDELSRRAEELPAEIDEHLAMLKRLGQQ